MTTTLSAVIKKILLIFLIILGLYFAKDFLIPLSIGGILATLFLPFCNWMEAKKIPKSIAVIFCLLTLLLSIFILESLLEYKITELLSDITILKQKALESFGQIQKYIFKHLDLSIEEQFKILKNEQPSYTNILQIIFGSISYLVSSIILILVYFVFLLYYRNHIKNFILQLTSLSQKAEVEKIIHSATLVSQQYLLGLSKMIFLLWIMYGIGFSILGVKNAIFFAVLCGLLEIIPYIGNIIGTLITVLVVALHGADVSLMFGIVITYMIVQSIQGWILEPLILGPQVKINSLFTIIALVLGELIWGIPGIILAIPLTAIIKIVCDHIVDLKPFGFLIGEIESTKKEISFIKKIKGNFSNSKNKKK